MAKIKKKNRNLADHIHTKKDAAKMKKPKNFFEVNKVKMRVLGQKLKNEKGAPGVARSKAIKRRKETLLQEYKHKSKSNRFVDRRIGERDRNMTHDDKVAARFAAVRVKMHNKKSIFNLAEDDFMLSHKGQALAEIEKFEDPRSDDDDDDENREALKKSSGNLDSDFVSNAHFGGGLLKNTGKDGARTHKELIDQLIAESKKRKAEKQKTKETTRDLTEKLDSEWKDLLPLLNQNRRNEEALAEKKRPDDYDKIMRELRFEARSTASDRLQTDEEIAKQQQELLEKFESERLERMKSNDEDNAKFQHRSADDLDDDFVYESDHEYELSYDKDGESNVRIDAQVDGKDVNNKDNGGEDDDGEEEEGSIEEDGEDEAESEAAESESEDDLSDLKAEESESDNAEESQNDEVKNETETKVEIEQEHIFACTDSNEALKKLLENLPSIENNAEKFASLLQHLNACGSQVHTKNSLKDCFVVFSILAPKIFEVAKLDEQNCHCTIKEMLVEKYEIYKKKHKTYPGIDVLIFLKLVGLLFPTSDFRHQIVTPSLVFMEQMLTKCKVNTQRDITFGIFLTTLVLEYTSLSKRYMPATINFLGGLLHMAIPKSGVKLIKVIPPFRATSTHLVLTDDHSNETLQLKMEISDLLDVEISEDFKIRSIYTVLQLIKEFDDQLNSLPSHVEIFSDIFMYLSFLPTKNYPEIVRNEFDTVIKQLELRKKECKLNYIVMEAKKPKALRLYEPKIERVFDGKRRKVQSKEKAEREKLMHKLKKETKGAMREIRRDKEFLGRVKLKQRIQSDKERQEKVKRIYAEASIQQSELNSLDRKKKRK